MKSFALICSVFIGVSLATKEFKEFKEICGIENVATSDRIINGIEASPNQFPWAVFIKIHIGHQIGTCTGSVISKNFILTAAHCLQGVSKAEIYAGTHDYSLESEPHRQYRLDEELEFNDFVRPACLPTLADVDTNLVGENTTISGWGRIRVNNIFEDRYLRPSQKGAPQIHFLKGHRHGNLSFYFNNKWCKMQFIEIVKVFSSCHKKLRSWEGEHDSGGHNISELKILNGRLSAPLRKCILGYTATHRNIFHYKGTMWRCDHKCLK
ncbi:unnamed protein product [Lepeophtheirus salmonis]|uniref:(salmon louse) hypothetical protein n=1 Tax=Lepeophtheirus salmonis TaxID=72036 RepID=A0A7R8CPX6_LEPSM|nr:unnamed protein product [Lepeophtheirus salmonis]CAF2855246.1 unnamed protein product [Lepeophtheirus salmonis]